MRLAFVLLVGCGRISFDARGDAAGSPDAFVCPPAYTFVSGSCYRAGIGEASWHDAEAACEADAVGAHLVVIDNAAEIAAIDPFRPSPTDFVWIGTSDIVTEGDYRSVTNRAMTYLVWATAEPEGPGENCLLLNAGGLLSDFDCANADDYVCEYDGNPAISVAWGICPANYLFAGTGCYRVDAIGGASDTTWHQAQARCEADGPGSHLVVIDSAAEAMTTAGLVSNIDHWVGLTDLVTEGEFLSVTGAPYAYEVWDSGEPSGGTASNCATLNDIELLASRPCTDGDDFMCEYDGIPAVPAAWGE